MKVNIKYIFVQGLFWSLYCVAMGFVSLYLLEKGVSNSGIGFTSAVFGLASAIIQPIFGRMCDKNRNVSWKKLAIICVVMFLVVCGIMIPFRGKIISVICIGLLIMLANLILPFINSALFYYEGAGEKINFGVARGIGSGMYAIVAYMIGIITASLGTVVVPVAGIIASILLMIVLISMPYSLEKDYAKNEYLNSDETVKNKESKAAFFNKYPAFIVMLIGFIFLQTTHSITCNFMLQIIQNIGGDSANLGVAMAIQAMLEVPVMFCFALILKKFTPTKLMIIAAFGYLLKSICYFGAASIIGVYLVQLTQIVSFALFASASVYYTGEMVGEEDRTTGQSLTASVIVMGNVVGSLLGGVIIDGLGVKHLLLINIGMAVIGTIIALLSLSKRFEKR